MSIDRTQRLQPVSTVQPRETPADNPLQPRKATAAETAVSATKSETERCAGAADAAGHPGY